MSVEYTNIVLYNTNVKIAKKDDKMLLCDSNNNKLINGVMFEDYIHRNVGLPNESFMIKLYKCNYYISHVYINNKIEIDNNTLLFWYKTIKDKDNFLSLLKTYNISIQGY